MTYFMVKKDYNEEISSKKKEIVAKQKDLLEIHIAKIREGYDAFPEIMLPKLEKLTKEFKRKNFVFDGERAKRIRIDTGLTLEKLAEKLGVSKSARTSISNYENEFITPSYPPKGKLNIPYFAWLKELGYDVANP